MGFETLEQAINESAALAPITPDEVRTSEDQWSDEVALGIVLEDTQSSLAYLQSKGLVPMGLENADDMVRAFTRPRVWADGKPRANLSMHVVLQAIEKILPQLYMSLFGQGKRRPFIVSPTGKTPPEAARANASLLAWAMKESNMKEEMRLSLKNALTYGFTITSWGWESRTQRKKVYAKKDGKMVGTLKSVPIELPTFECLDLHMVLFDPGLKRQDVCTGGAKFVVKQFMTTGYGLCDLRETGLYKGIPSDDELAMFLANMNEPTEDSMRGAKRVGWREFQAELDTKATSKDPMNQPLEILEYTSKDRIVTVLQRKLVLRNETNEWGRLNFNSCAFVDVLGSAWGWGVAKLLSGEQRLQQGVMNNWIDSLALQLNPVFQLLKGLGPGTQNVPLSPGKIINESGELKPLLVPSVSKEALEAIATSDERASQKVAANGGSSMPNGAMRTAEGVQAFAGDVTVRLQYFLEQFINLIYVPTLEAYLEMLHDHLTIEQVNAILTTQEGKAYEGDITDVYNAELNVDVLAGSNMLAKFASAQLAPMIIQLVSAGPVAQQFETSGIKFDYMEFVRETLDMQGWDVENLVIPQTAEDMQRVKDNNQAMQKAQGDQQLQQQKQQDDLASIDAKGSAQAGVAVVRSILKNHEESGINMAESMQDPASQQNGGGGQ
jgi:hypothetical protein